MLYTVAYIILVRILLAYAGDVHVNPFNFKTILSTSKCAHDDDVLIVVHSSVQRFYSRRRMLMRSTWLQPETLSHKLNSKIKIVFILGSSLSRGEQEKVKYENELYKDIVQYDFIDHYHNNTYKAMGYLRWVAENCVSVPLLIKIDDDLLFNEKSRKLFNQMLNKWLSRSDNFYTGRPLIRTPVRSKDSAYRKWYVSYEDWPEELFPESYQGLIYALSPRMAGHLYNISLETRYIFTDDVYVGILIDKLKRYTPVTLIPDSNISGLNSVEFEVNNTQMKKEWSMHKFAVYHVPDFRCYWEWYITNKNTAHLFPPNVGQIVFITLYLLSYWC